MPIIQIQNVSKRFRAKRGLTAVEVAITTVVLVVVVAAAIAFVKERRRLVVQADADANPEKFFRVSAAPTKSSFTGDRDISVDVEISNTSSTSLDFKLTGYVMKHPEDAWIVWFDLSEPPRRFSIKKMPYGFTVYVRRIRPLGRIKFTVEGGSITYNPAGKDRPESISGEFLVGYYYPSHHEIARDLQSNLITFAIEDTQ